jgi:hypothetical protein
VNHNFAVVIAALSQEDWNMSSSTGIEAPCTVRITGP